MLGGHRYLERGDGERLDGTFPLLGIVVGPIEGGRSQFETLWAEESGMVRQEPDGLHF